MKLGPFARWAIRRILNALCRRRKVRGAVERARVALDLVDQIREFLLEECEVGK